MNKNTDLQHEETICLCIVSVAAELAAFYNIIIILFYHCRNARIVELSMSHFVYSPMQWKMMLQCNIVSHWLGTYTKWALNERTISPCHICTIENLRILKLWRTYEIITTVTTDADRRKYNVNTAANSSSAANVSTAANSSSAANV